MMKEEVKMNDEAMLRFLEEFAQAWNNHDLDALMSMMADDCTYECSSGPFVYGGRYEGREAVRAGFANVFETIQNAHFGDDSHFVCGSRGVSEWVLTGERADGTRVEVNGCDIFTFQDGKIAFKNSFLKNRTAY